MRFRGRTIEDNLFEAWVLSIRLTGKFLKVKLIYGNKKRNFAFGLPF